MVKLVYVIRRREGLSAEEFRRYWLEVHAPKVVNVAKDIRARRYVQSHTLDTPLNQAFAESRGRSPFSDGITEVWWDNLDDLMAGASTPEGSAAYEMLRTAAIGAHSQPWTPPSTVKVGPSTAPRASNIGTATEARAGDANRSQDRVTEHDPDTAGFNRPDQTPAVCRRPRAGCSECTTPIPPPRQTGCTAAWRWSRP